MKRDVIRFDVAFGLEFVSINLAAPLVSRRLGGTGRGPGDDMHMALF